MTDMACAPHRVSGYANASVGESGAIAQLLNTTTFIDTSGRDARIVDASCHVSVTPGARRTDVDVNQKA